MLLGLGPACTIKVTPPADGGTVDAGSQTVAEQCAAIGTALCQAYPTCGIAPSLSDCVNSYVTSCCTGSTCGQTALSSAAAVTACTNAYASPDCNAIASGQAPAACQGLPSKP